MALPPPRSRRRPGRPRPDLVLVILLGIIVAVASRRDRLRHSQASRGFGSPPPYKPPPMPPAERGLSGKRGGALGTRTSATGEKYVVQVRRGEQLEKMGGEKPAGRLSRHVPLNQPIILPFISASHFFFPSFHSILPRRIVGASALASTLKWGTGTWRRRRSKGRPRRWCPSTA